MTTSAAGVTLEDNRTGLSITLSSADSRAADNSEDIAFILQDLGFYSDLEVCDLHSRQLPYRREWQKEARQTALEELLEFVLQHVRYYKDRADRYKIPTPQDPDLLKDLPIMLKSDLRSHAFSMISEDTAVKQRSNPSRISWARTSGTTGEQLQVPVDMFLGRVPPGYEEVWGIRFDNETPRTAVLTTPRCTAVECHLSLKSREDRIKWDKTLFCNAPSDPFDASSDIIREFIDDLWAFRPEILVVNPIYLHVFLSRAAALHLQVPSIKIVLSTYQYMSALQRKYFELSLGASVRSMYSATELGGCQIAVECGCGHLHVREDHCVVEIGPSENTAPSIGPLLVTTVTNRLMPLIRYRLGDLVQLSDDCCQCKLVDWRCLELHGRETETLLISGKLVTTKEVDDRMSLLDGIDFYQIQQSRDLKMLSVHVIASANGCDLGAVTSKIKRIFKTEVHVTAVSSLRSLPSEKIPLILPRAA